MIKKVLVTGATGDIGCEIVKKFAQNGYFVLIHYRSNYTKAKELLDEIDGIGELIKFDMTNKSQIEKALEDVSVDVLVNNAGVIDDALFFHMSDESWESVIDANLNGTYQVTKALFKSMMMKKNGSIVNVVSVSGVVGNAGQCNYAASKGALNAFTKSLALELGRYNVRVNAIAPAIINSGLVDGIKNKDELKKLIPLNRFGEPSEVADVVYFVGVQASYINAQVINVCGGMVRG